MSIILDALKKAEKDRHFGELPGLYSPASTASRSPNKDQGVTTGMLWFGVAVTVLLMTSTAAWWLARSDVTAAPAVTLQPPLALQSSPQLPSAPPPTSPTPAVPRQPSVVPVREIPVPPPLMPSPPQLVSKTAPTTSAKMPSQNTASARQLTSAREAASSEKVMTLAELSPAMQRELPPLVIGGSMYSDNAAERMLLIDKHLLHEGDEVAPGLILEKLMPKAAVLRFRGNRFRIDF